MPGVLVPAIAARMELTSTPEEELVEEVLESSEFSAETELILLPSCYEFEKLTWRC